MKVQYFTFVLNPIDQQSLFKVGKNKVQLFRDILTNPEPIKFEAQGMKLAARVAFNNGNYAILRFGKEEIIDINLSPEKNFAMEHVENWPHCLMFINFDSNPTTGQRIAFEYRAEIFRNPHVQLSAFSNEINTRLIESGYVSEINAVTTERKFWETINENESQIKKLVLTFNSPNFLNLNSALSDELKGIEKEYGATKTTIQLENPEGKLKVPHSALIEQGAEYITKGGGSYSLQIKSQKGYIKDKDNIETKEVIDINLESPEPDTVIKTLNLIFKKDA